MSLKSVPETEEWGNTVDTEKQLNPESSIGVG